MMRFAAMILAALAFLGCATGVITDDKDAPAAAVQAVNLTCGWLINNSTPPTREEMADLGWRRTMTRDEAVIPDFMRRFSKGPPALAGYRLRFGDTGDIIASYWEDYCYGILSSDLLPEGDGTRQVRAKQTLAALEVWVSKAMPDAVPGQLSFAHGETKLYVAKANSRLAFSAIVLDRGGVEWRLVPSRTPTVTIGATPLRDVETKP